MFKVFFFFIRLLMLVLEKNPNTLGSLILFEFLSMCTKKQDKDQRFKGQED